MSDLEIMVGGEWQPLGTATGFEPVVDEQQPEREPWPMRGFTASVELVDEGGALRALFDSLPPWHPLPRRMPAGPALLAAMQRAVLPASHPRCSPVAFDLDELALQAPASLTLELARYRAEHIAEQFRRHANAHPLMPRAMLEGGGR